MFEDVSVGLKNRLFQALLVLALVASVLLAAKIFTEVRQYQYVGQNLNPSNTITVSGNAEVFAKPDIATISFSVQGKGKTPALAQEGVNTKMANIEDALKKYGIEEKDIKTINYTSSPTYQYPDSKTTPTGAEYYYPYPSQRDRTIVGYEVEQWTEVKIRKIDDANKILGGLGELGATNISNISFSVDNEEKYQEDARKMAIEEAKEKADRLADDLGVWLVRIVSFSENGYSPYYAKGLDKAVMGMGGAESAPAPVVSPGENKIVSNVTITYEIR